MEEAVQKIQNFNGIEELMGVHQSQRSKGEVYEAFKKEFKDLFIQLEISDKQKVEVNANIEASIGPFSHICAQVTGDSSKSEFYKKLDVAIQVYEELSNMMSQGS